MRTFRNESHRRTAMFWKAASATSLAGSVLLAASGRAQAQTIPNAYAVTQFSENGNGYNVLGNYDFASATFSKINVTNLTTVVAGAIPNPTLSLSSSDPAHGALAVRDVGNIDGIAFNPNGFLYTVNDTVPTGGTSTGSNIVFTVNLLDSAPNYAEQFKIKGLDPNAVTDSIAFERNQPGVPLYALVDVGTNSFLYTVDYTTSGSLGASTLIGQLQLNGANFFTNGTLAATPDSSLYVTQGSAGNKVYKIDLSSATGGNIAVSAVGTAGFGTNPVYAMAAPFSNGNQNLMYAVDSGSPGTQYKVDPNTPTGVSTIPGTYNTNEVPPGFGPVFGLAFGDFASPEPSSVALALPGALMLLGGLRIRARRSRKA